MTSPVPKVTHEDHGNSGRYVVAGGAAGDAELTWRAAGPGMIVADHTFSPPEMRGTGAAAAMVQRLILDARSKGLRIVPACSYVRAQMDRHPEWADLRADG